jgi:RimJ/RimL family protein N-acetyltransferase
VIVIGERALGYVSAKLDYHPFGPVTAIGIERDGRIVAGAAFAFYTGTDIEITIAAEPRYFTRGFMRAMAHYVYQQSGCIRASFMTELPHVVTVLRKAGATIEGVKRNAYGPGRDGVMLGLLREEWYASQASRHVNPRLISETLAK